MGAGGRGGGSFDGGAGLANPSVGAGHSWFAAGCGRGGGGGRGFCYAFRQGTCTDPACACLFLQ